VLLLSRTQILRQHRLALRVSQTVRTHLRLQVLRPLLALDRVQVNPIHALAVVARRVLSARVLLEHAHSLLLAVLRDRLLRLERLLESPRVVLLYVGTLGLLTLLLRSVSQ